MVTDSVFYGVNHNLKKRVACLFHYFNYSHLFLSQKVATIDSLKNTVFTQSLKIIFKDIIFKEYCYSIP